MIIGEFVDSSFRWNDEFEGNHFILGHTISQELQPSSDTTALMSEIEKQLLEM